MSEERDPQHTTEMQLFKAEMAAWRVGMEKDLSHMHGRLGIAEQELKDSRKYRGQIVLAMLGSGLAFASALIMAILQFTRG